MDDECIKAASSRNALGYYRVNYDGASWELIVNQLLIDFQRIPLINRAQLLDDSLNVARVNALIYAVPLQLSKYLVSEREYIPWRSALSGLSYIDLMFSRASGYGDFKVSTPAILISLQNCY